MKSWNCRFQGKQARFCWDSSNWRRRYWDCCERGHAQTWAQWTLEIKRNAGVGSLKLPGFEHWSLPPRKRWWSGLQERFGPAEVCSWALSPGKRKRDIKEKFLCFDLEMRRLRGGRWNRLHECKSYCKRGAGGLLNWHPRLVGRSSHTCRLWGEERNIPLRW